jgi:dihydrofolate synthase/folylpolyglutamate synthase
MTDLTYDEALGALTARGRYGIQLGLGRIRALLHELGDPQQGLRGALVAGTNGKGSVLALCSAALRASGVLVGETPKPHLVTYRERLVSDGRPIDPVTFARLVSEVVPIADRVSRRLGPPTEFEILTAIVFRWFAEVGVEVGLVEVGLGGRLDATHAWDGGVAVVTNVDLDHTDRLGPTISHIAREKAAIIERGDRAVTGADGEALAIVRRRARRLAVPLIEVEAAPLLAWDRDGIEVALTGLGRTRVGLRGRHQAANVAIADATLDALEASGIAAVRPDQRQRGYAEARWPGRLELVTVPGSGGRPVDVLLDGAHNPAGAAALALALDDLRPHLVGGAGPDAPPLTCIMGAMADKDVDGVIVALSGAAALRGARIIATRPEVPRAMAPELLAARWTTLASGAEPVADPRAALDVALAEAPGPIVVAGSLYLVGAIRAMLVDDPTLVDPVGPIGRTVAR